MDHPELDNDKHDNKHNLLQDQANFRGNDLAARWLANHGNPGRKKSRRKRQNRKKRLAFYQNASRKRKLPEDTVVIGTDGPPCHRCCCPTEIREHKEVGPKELRRQYYYSRWFKCVNPYCRTTEIMREEFKVFPPKPSSRSEVERRLVAIGEQLREDPLDCADIATADAF